MKSIAHLRFCQKNYIKLFNALLAGSLGLLVCTAPMLALAQYNPPKRGTPGRREGAGTRGSCIQGVKPLMPLTPVDAFGTTSRDRPTFFWYVPATTATTAEFALLDGSDQELYKTLLPLSQAPSVVSFKLPTSVALAKGKDYRWQFSVVCDAESPSKNPFVEGLIQRIDLDPGLTRQIEKAAPRDLPDLYAEAGVWYEALTTMADLRCSRPDDALINARWIKLLKSVELSDFATEPLPQYCTQISGQ